MAPICLNSIYLYETATAGSISSICIHICPTIGPGRYEKRNIHSSPKGVQLKVHSQKYSKFIHIDLILVLRREQHIFKSTPQETKQAFTESTTQNWNKPSPILGFKIMSKRWLQYQHQNQHMNQDHHQLKHFFIIGS